MPEEFRFPNGYNVKVLRKDEILKTINDNIIDKEIALDIIETCEVDASNFLRDGRWVGIPYIGNIRIPPKIQIAMSNKTKELFKEAKELLDENKYILFRQNYYKEANKQVKQERYYKYILSQFVGRNIKFFNFMSKLKGDKAARVICYSFNNLEPLDDEQIQTYNRYFDYYR